MGIDEVVQIISDALYCVIETSAPVLIISLIVGLVISIFQTITSIHEQTLTFVPKFLAIFATLMLLGHWMLDTMISYMETLWADFSIYIR